MTYDEANELKLSNRQTIENFIGKKVTLKNSDNSKLWKVLDIKVWADKIQSPEDYNLIVYLFFSPKQYKEIQFLEFLNLNEIAEGL